MTRSAPGAMRHGCPWRSALSCHYHYAYLKLFRYLAGIRQVTRFPRVVLGQRPPPCVAVLDRIVHASQPLLEKARHGSSHLYTTSPLTYPEITMGQPKHGRSVVPGVSRHKGKWRARVHHGGEWFHLGLYLTEQEAENTALDALTVLAPERLRIETDFAVQKYEPTRRRPRRFGTLGGRVWLFRKVRKMSVRRAAALAGISRRTWQALEVDRYQCLAVTLVAVALALGVSLDRLWGYEVPPEGPPRAA